MQEVVELEEYQLLRRNLYSLNLDKVTTNLYDKLIFFCEPKLNDSLSLILNTPKTSLLRKSQFHNIMSEYVEKKDPIGEFKFNLLSMIYDREYN